MADTPPSLRLLTLNVWGLKYVAAHRQERIRAIAEYICTPDYARERTSSSVTSSTSSGSAAGNGEGTPLHPQYRNGNTGNGNGNAAKGKQRETSDEGHGSRWDIVCLQELWCSEDWEYLQARARESGSGLVHGRYFYSGALGSGLCILSRFPIVATSTWPYSMNGSPLHVIEGDFYVAKACGQATLDLAAVQGFEGVAPLTVLNTHFFAPGGDWGEEWKRSHRLAQAWELARLANVAAERGQDVIVCGDMNSQPTSLPMNLLLSHARLSDSWSVAHPPSSLSALSNPPTPQEAIQINGMTCDSPLNTWSAGKRFGEDIIRQGGKRLDYILYRRADRYRQESKKAIKVEECTVTAMENVPGEPYSLSDHYGVETKFSYSPPQLTQNQQEREEEELPVPHRSGPREAITLAFAAISIYSSRSTKSSKAQLSLFYASLLSIPILAVAASFQPLKWLNWIFVLLGTGAGVGGATMLYTGFVGGRRERSAVKNVLSDMSVELERLERMGQ